MSTLVNSLWQRVNADRIGHTYYKIEHTLKFTITFGISRRNWAYYTTKLSTPWTHNIQRVYADRTGHTLLQNWAHYGFHYNRGYMQTELGVLYYKIEHTIDPLQKGYMQIELGILYCKIEHTMDSPQRDGICRQNRAYFTTKLSTLWIPLWQRVYKDKIGRTILPNLVSYVLASRPRGSWLRHAPSLVQWNFFWVVKIQQCRKLTPLMKMPKLWHS